MLVVLYTTKTIVEKFDRSSMGYQGLVKVVKKLRKGVHKTVFAQTSPNICISKETALKEALSLAREVQKKQIRYLKKKGIHNSRVDLSYEEEVRYYGT